MACEWVYVYVRVKVYLFVYYHSAVSLTVHYVYTCLYSMPDDVFPYAWTFQ